MTTISISEPHKYIDLCPDLSALVSLAWHSAKNPNNELPISQFLIDKHAVASSIRIGSGSSFLITRKTVPAVQRVWENSKPWQGVTVQANHAPSVRPSRQIVYKVARVHFDEQGDPVSSQRVNYASILLDLMVLSHDPILNHPSIVSMLGLAWGNNGFPKSCEIPVPIIEHANLGNLADHQASHVLETSQKLSILRNVATGIHFLHQCSIAHGDVKSENVLLFQESQGEVSAKISDFGFAVLGDQGHFNFLPRGTLLWSAPEVRNGTLKTGEAPFSDVYSYGLLFWRVMIDGIDPLSPYFLLSDAKREAQAKNKQFKRVDGESLEKFMQLDYLGGQALPSVWKPKYHALKLRPLPERQSGSAFQAAICLQGLDVSSDETLECCEAVIRLTLLRDPTQRNLASAITRLGPHPSTIPAPTSIKLREKYDVLMANSYALSWGALRAAPPAVCNHIMRQKLCKHQKNSGNGNDDYADFAFGLACCSISGMGSDRHIDVARAKQLLLTAANRGSTGAQAVIPRFCRTFGHSFNGLTEALTKCAGWGSLAALEDLPLLDQDCYLRARSFLRTNMCGVGAQLFRYWNPPWLMEKLKTFEFVKNHLERSPEPPDQIEINPRGDGLLHAAASLAQLDTVKWLINHHKIDVNQRNAQGETALHGSLRSGNIDIANWLLDNGADVTTETTYSHESPVHWLVSTEGEESHRMAIRLLPHEASHKPLTVWANKCGYASTFVSGYKDRWDNLTEGTPLHWAICRKRLDLVKILLSHGADPQYNGTRKSNLTSFELAAFLHEHEILSTMIEFKYPGPRFPYFDLGARNSIHQESTYIANGSIPQGLSIWVKEAIRGCDNWKMLFRHGHLWKQKMEETFKILGHELSFAYLNEGVDGDNLKESPLNYAAKHGFHEAVEMIMIHMNGKAGIDERTNVNQYTPIFWAIIRDNKRMFYNLLEHGADVHIRVNSPNRRAWWNWTLLHIAAQNVIEDDLEVSRKLLDLGLPIDGVDDPVYGGPPQTPLSIALEENQFELASLLLERGANINASCSYIHFQRTKLAYECSILGCIVASNLRFSTARLKYLLWPSSQSHTEHQDPDFVVVPQFGFTALHVAAMGAAILVEPEERDSEVAAEILGLLLERYETADEINSQCEGDMMTALHIAVQSSNLVAVQLLLDMEEIEVGVENVAGQTAMDLGQEALAELSEEGRDKGKTEQKLKDAVDILKLLEEHIVG